MSEISIEYDKYGWGVKKTVLEELKARHGCSISLSPTIDLNAHHYHYIMMIF
jgi:hypothetical protein